MNLFLILGLGLFLRIAYIIKPEGLWNDEYVSWAIASTPFNSGFWHEVLHQCHMPLYYLYLKFFGDTELFLRLSSVLPNLFAIYIMYTIGKLHNKSMATCLGLITACTSFLVYYSQEVRFYSLLFLFSSLMLLFVIKYLKENNRKNLLGYIISAILVLLTHTIGFVYVFITSLLLIIKSKKKRALIIASTASIIMTIPFAIYIFTSVGTSQWWGSFTYRNIIFMFTDFLSPILTNNINIPSLILYKEGPFFAITLLVPTFIALAMIIYSIYKDKIAKDLAIVAFFTIFILSIVAISGKFVFITKYSIEILPILLYLFALGLSTLPKKIMILVITVWLSFHIGYFCSTDYPTKIPRSEGNRIPISLLYNENPSIEDKIIFTYYNADRFEKYFNIKKYDVISIDKAKTTQIITNNHKLTPPEYINERKHIEDSLKTILTSKKRTFIIFLDSVAFFPDEILNAYNSSSQKINNTKIHPMYIESSILKNEFIKYAKKYNYKIKFNTMGSWTLLTISKEKK